MFFQVSDAFGGLDSLVIVPPENTVKGFIHQSTSMQFDQVGSFGCIDLLDSEQPGIPWGDVVKSGKFG